jgi:FtsP/CotA-like multicopper oxidase with cupredoxin domain
MATHAHDPLAGAASAFTGPFTQPPAAPREFADNMPHEGSPETPGKVRPDIAFERDFFNDKFEMPDGEDVEFWAFEDEQGRRTFPSPTIRVREGQIVHTTVKASKGPHTIHHHGIETDDFNDGVGHTSFEVTGHYTYQWRAAQAGTYFYHCHVNTTLHFEMGMWGALIIDPPEGPGRAFRGGPRYDVEAIWAAGGVDPDKHELNQAAGLDGEDAGLNLWNPRYFHISGAFHPDSLSSPRAAVTASPGQTILARIINAGYFPQRWTFGGLDAEVIASDGRPFGTIEGDEPPFAIPNPQSFRTTELLVGSAERYDCILRATRPGRHIVRVEHLDWITGDVVGIAETTITISGDVPPSQSTPDPGAGGTPSSAPPSNPAASPAGAPPSGASSGQSPATHAHVPASKPPAAPRKRRVPLKRRVKLKRRAARKPKKRLTARPRRTPLRGRRRPKR